MSVRSSLAAAACAVALVVGAAACTDKVDQPTAPKAAAAAPVAVAAAPSKAPNGSTVCLAYMSKRAEAKVRLDKATERAKALAAKKALESADDAKARVAWKRKVEKFEAMMADACR